MLKPKIFFRINESGKDPGFGQSILHEGQLIFRTPPYNTSDLTIHDVPPPVWSDTRNFSSANVKSKVNLKICGLLIAFIL